MAFPGTSAYSATKFALEGWSEVLAAEAAPFGVHVLIVEPSRFRTSFNAPGVLAFAGESDAYAGTLTGVRAAMADADGRQEGDPAKAARTIVALAHADAPPLRLPLGAEAVERIETAYRRGLDELGRWADTARAADHAPANL